MASLTRVATRLVSMVSMLFPWHCSGILWHPGGMLWNAMEVHGIQNIAIVYMVSMLFPCDTQDRIILTVEIYGIWDKISEWKAMDIATLLKIGCRIHWNAMK